LGLWPGGALRRPLGNIERPGPQCHRALAEGRDELAVRGTAVRLCREIEDRAGRAFEICRELRALVRSEEARHRPNEARIVDPPEPPFGKRVRLLRMRAVQPFVRFPLRLAADVVPVVAD